MDVGCSYKRRCESHHAYARMLTPLRHYVLNAKKLPDKKWSTPFAEFLRKYFN